MELVTTNNIDNPAEGGAKEEKQQQAYQWSWLSPQFFVFSHGTEWSPFNSKPVVLESY